MLGSKWKKRLVVFRFQTASGPPILEVSKDEKKSSQRETLDLSVTTSIEVRRRPGWPFFFFFPPVE